MIAVIAAIAEPFFFLAITAIVPIIWKPGLTGQIPILHLQTIFLWTENVIPLRAVELGVKEVKL